ncbi:MAG: hypothetical protein ACXWZ2_12215, partial [Mycobacterium sp.]
RPSSSDRSSAVIRRPSASAYCSARHAADTGQRVHDICGAGQVADDDICSQHPKLLCTLVIAVHHRPHLLTD